MAVWPVAAAHPHSSAWARPSVHAPFLGRPAGPGHGALWMQRVRRNARLSATRNVLVWGRGAVLLVVRVARTRYDRATQSKNKISAAAASAITTITFIPVPSVRSSYVIVMHTTSRR